MLQLLNTVTEIKDHGVYISSNRTKCTKLQGILFGYAFYPSVAYSVGTSKFVCCAPHLAPPQPQPLPQKVFELQQQPYSIDFQVGEEKGGWVVVGGDK